MHRLFIVLISLLATESFAAELANLYQSPVPVVSQSEQERQQLAPEVLRQVILKVVGDRSAIDVTDLSPVLGQANKLVQQFQYERINEITEDLTQPDRLALLLKFNEPSLNKSLTNLGLPIWSKTRPDVLVWLALDDGQNRTVIGAESSEHNIPVLLEQAAELRGLPIFLPVMDLQDHAQVKFADVWGDFSDSIELASQRYAPQVILIARVSMEGRFNSQIHWHALINGQSENWQSRGELPTALTAGIEELTDRLARRFTQVVSSNQYEQQLALQITNVGDYADFARLMQYLSKLQYVSDVKLSSLETDKVDVTLSLKGERSVFNQTLSIGRVLVEDTSYNSSSILRYRLMP
ncbi:MAG: hypothetical protein COC04_00975 [Gammaproteobacteria bacterium]|nr:MAG: hypothetical protein COC04_00975 [Gammaproteobacteria bacterium]